jgi:hypothetical protein
MVTKSELVKLKRYARDVKRALKRSTNVGISAYNYDLEPDDEVIAELRKLLPQRVEISSRGFMGYIHFEMRNEAPE